MGNLGPRTTNLLKQACPSCGRVNNKASGLATPKPGEASICYGCEQLAIFDKNLSVRLPTPEEVLEFRENHMVDAAIRAIRENKARNRARNTWGFTN